MNSPAVTPEQLAVAARALAGYIKLEKVRGEWVGYYPADTQHVIGSDADLLVRLLRYLSTISGHVILEFCEGVTGKPAWRCAVPMRDVRAYHANVEGPDELAAVIACIAAMGAKSHKIADHHPDRHLYDPSRWLP
jgi:hypothetical protein